MSQFNVKSGTLHAHLPILQIVVTNQRDGKKKKKQWPHQLFSSRNVVSCSKTIERLLVFLS